MTFKEKFNQVVSDIIKEDPKYFDYCKDEDDAEVLIYDIIPFLEGKVFGWPVIAVREEGCDLKVESIDTENNEVEVFDDHAHIFAGGDWQFPADFDIVLNKNSKTSEKYPFIACNIMCRNKFDGKEITKEDL